MTTTPINPADHPIDPAVRTQIEAEIAAIEAKHDVRVLFACESGSRGWGFASPDSDYDVRFIYVHRLDWYLRVAAQRDVIELPISGDLDINGWELRKALGLLKKGNATLIEWLDSPVVYRADAGFVVAMREAARLVHRPERSFHHYLHMARGNFREYLQGDVVRLKKYLYVLRPILGAMWVERGRGLVPMRFQELVDGLVDDPTLKDAIARLLVLKRAAGEAMDGAPMPEINAFIAAQLKRLEGAAPPLTDTPDDAPLDALLRETVLTSV
jgi:uncharacterized protein